MSRATINAMCAVFPGAEDTDPWGDGHDAWKIGGKMFACMGASEEGVSVKTDSIETATMLIDAGVGRKARYFHRSWINLPFDCAEDQLWQRLAVSYRIVRSALPARVRAGLPPEEDPALLHSRYQAARTG